MHNFLVVIFVLCFSLCFINQELSIWPIPSIVDGQTQNFTYVIENWKAFEFTGSQHPYIVEAIKRYRKYTFYDDSIPSEDCERCVKGLKITVADEDIKDSLPTLEMNEEYSLRIDSAQSHFFIESPSVWGALRGLETFSQLVSIQSGKYSIKETPFQVRDKPRFRWRGLLIDTSRHYLRLSTIEKIIDGLSFAKMNTLHWHIIDAHSFPMEVKQYNMLHLAGSFAPYAFYKHEDINRIVMYAASRGIRVVPEFDVPAHTASWGFHYPIVAQCPPAESQNINNFALNPALNQTYDIVESVLKEAQQLFPDQFIHLGADEVVKACWSVDDTIKTFMEFHGWGTDYDKLQAYFFKRLEPMVKDKISIFWDELLEGQSEYPIPKTAVIEAWRSHLIFVDAVKKGYKAILAHGFYLDRQNPHFDQTVQRYAFDQTWMDFYENEPFRDHRFNPEQRNLVLGIEACAWGEQVDDTNIIQRIFPRILGASERSWSNIEKFNANDTILAAPRLETHRCRLVRRGIEAGPIAPVIPGIIAFCDAPYRNKD